MTWSTRRLRCAGDRRGRKRRAHERAEPDVGAESAAHGAHEVVEARVRLHRAQLRYRDRARRADPAEVVAGEVDDHHVLGVVLGARRGAVTRSTAGALDRAGLDVDAAVARRKRSGDAETTASCAPASSSRAARCAVRDAVDEGAVQADGVERAVAGEPPGEVDLVALARVEELEHLADAGLVVVAVERRVPRPVAIRRGWGRRRVARRRRRLEQRAARAVALERDRAVGRDQPRVESGEHDIRNGPTSSAAPPGTR